MSLVDGSIKAVDGPFTEAKEPLAGTRWRFEARLRRSTKRLMQIHKDHWPGWEGSCEVRQGDS